MLKKLRIKFIVLTMLSLLLVLTIIISCINLLNYRGIIKNADTILFTLEKNNGKFLTEPEKPKNKADKPDNKSEKPEELTNKPDNIPDNPKDKSDEPKEPDNNPDNDKTKNNPMPPSFRNESPYFSVELDTAGNVLTVNTNKMSSLDASDAEEYAKNVLALERQKGFSGSLRYLNCTTENGFLIIFLDCGRELSTFRNFLLTSCGISFLGLAAVLCLIILFSGRIIKPVSESYEKQKRFITDAGHELKTPLTIIEADADVLEMDIGENEWLSDIKKQTYRLSELTKSLICLSRMEEEQNQFQMIDFPISDVVQETAQSFYALAQTQEKSFSSHIQPMLSLCGDENAIRQLITILLDNALKYSMKGETISLSLEKQGKTMKLSVYNTGTSITKENISHIFNRFYRADSSRNSKTGGTGLGLSIAKAIVSAHKGKITASTQDEKSLLVTVTLHA